MLIPWTKSETKKMIVFRVYAPESGMGDDAISPALDTPLLHIF
jgi:hypothetical protein